MMVMGIELARIDGVELVLRVQRYDGNSWLLRSYLIRGLDTQAANADALIIQLLEGSQSLSWKLEEIVDMEERRSFVVDDSA